ncbi:uncharacterized protein LOC123904681 [Trifolium pratense]|uniref:Uncharacterized protein n=1 Tax=Trifolium pratense TaxID=57577 RepID=A0ACB0K0Y7_TRIPR|nr:uncharacterized protein LOC123904681 [Trifolium pratense]CAJ2650181.1 unnamed protein product [Trifolium pratense]
MGKWERDIWIWKPEWSALLSETESVFAQDLLLILDQVRSLRTGSDRPRWNLHAAGFFTVKSVYVALQNRSAVRDIGPTTAKALKCLWLNNVPSKVSIFGWRLLLEKLPTREALYKKGIITNIHERCCVFCYNEVEDTQHIFFKCTVSEQETIARGSGTLFGWQQRGVYGVNAITFYLEETSLMCLL